MQPPIEDYGIIGDCRSAALISRRGSLDWLCWPRFDSPSLFGRLLDPRAGCWELKASGRCRADRRYRPDTNILQTRFTTSTGTLVVTDFMPVASEEHKADLMMPEHEVVRIASCIAGEVELECLYEPMPDYGRRLPRLNNGPLGLRCETGQGLLTLRSDMPLQVDGSWAYGREKLRAGDKRYFSLALAAQWPAVLPPLRRNSRLALERSAAWWKDWAGTLRYQGPHREAVVRSALAIRLMIFAPSGAIVAAPTTSLPELAGGGHNWDYRYCWLRDASLTARALLGLGCFHEADAFVDWLLHSTRLTRPQLRPLYDVFGERARRETTLPHLTGYRASRPVRTGNAAEDQVQLDVYGEVVEAAVRVIEAEKKTDRQTRRMLVGFGEWVCGHWRDKDRGMWEPREPDSHHTHSLVMCWSALEKLLDLHRKGYLPECPVDKFTLERGKIRDFVERNCWDEELGSYVAGPGRREVDSNLLLLPWHGYEKAGSSRMRGTYEAVRRRLGTWGGLLHRTERHRRRGEGGFGLSTFWAPDYLARGGGSAAQAQALLGRLLGYANELGLFAETIRPSGAALGNFPQAFTHIGVINAALSLELRLKREAGKVPA